VFFFYLQPLGELCRRATQGQSLICWPEKIALAQR